MKQEWNTLEWLNNAKGLVHWAGNNSNTGAIMLVVRHSHREDSQEVQQLLKMRLTELGHKMAFQFGRESPSLQRVEISYSRHHRCHETAKDIAKGYNSRNVKAKLVSDIRVLLGPQGNGNRIGHEMLSLEGPEFINRWAAGQLSAATIEPIEEFGKVFITETIGRLRRASSNTMHIHVTHDLVIMGARNILFGTIATKENWTPFLGGFGVIRQGNQLCAYENGGELILNI